MAEVPITDRQLLFVTGKGGVGKTTIAAALARASRDAGQRTLVAEVTSDVSARSHLLGHFGVATAARGEEPIKLGPNLDGVRITPSIGHRLFLRAALRVGMLADAAMRSAALNRFLMAAPAFPEIGTLYQLVWLLRRQEYEKIVIDLPATGHALGLAKLPRTVSRVVPMGLIKEAITEGLAIMTDPKRTGAVVATLPESLPVTEAFELARGLEELEVPVGALVLNRMPANPFTEEERKMLDDHIRQRRGELLLGTRELRRLERALEARETFREAPLASAKLAELPVYEGRWSKVIEQVAGGLAEAGVAPSREEVSS
ncbi:MAG: ArsA family ATPase [Myxococcota bacterium]